MATSTAAAASPSPTLAPTTSASHTYNHDALRHMMERIMKNRCRNATNTLLRELRRLLQGTTTTTTTPTQRSKSKTEDSLAVLYIVFVLFFFAASLLVLLMKYLRRERESGRLQKFYEDYMENRTPSMVVHYDISGRRLRRTPPPHPALIPTPTPTATPPPTPTHATTTPIHARDPLDQGHV